MAPLECFFSHYLHAWKFFCGRYLINFPIPPKNEKKNNNKKRIWKCQNSKILNDGLFIFNLSTAKVICEEDKECVFYFDGCNHNM
jgi:hypothetical protein